MQRSHIFLSTILLLLLSCKKEISEPCESEPIPYIESTDHLGGDMISVDFSGHISLALSNLADSVYVQIGDAGGYTQPNGDFFLKDVTVDNKRAVLSVNTGSRFNIHQSIVPHEGRMNYCTAQEPRSSSDVFFQSSLGGISFSGPSWHFDVDFDELLNHSGQSYVGTCYSHKYDLTRYDEEFYSDVLGDMLSLDATGELKYLEPYSYFAIRVKDNLGQDLFLPEGSVAEAAFAIPPELANSAPQTISIWKYDETDAIWKQVTTAESTPNPIMYLCELNQFGHYMAATTLDPVLIEGRVLTESSGLPLAHINMKVRSDERIHRQVTTDGEGYYRVWVPDSTPLYLNGESKSGEELFDVSIGEASSVPIEDILIDESVFTYMVGKHVDCHGDPLPGYFKTVNSPYARYFKIGEEGQFILPLAYPYMTFPYTFYDNNLENPLHGYITTQLVDSIYTGTLLHCDIPTPQYLSYSIDGSGEILVNGNVSYEESSQAGSDILITEFDGEYLGDSHNMVFESIDFAGWEAGQEQLVSPVILTIVNSGVILGRFESSSDFEFNYIGMSPYSEATIMFEFSGVMNSTIGGEDITVSGIGVVKRP